MGLLELWLITAPLWAILCALIAQSKGLNVGTWALVGVLFGILGVLFAAMAGREGSSSSYSGSRVPDTDPFSTRVPSRQAKSTDTPEGTDGNR